MSATISTEDALKNKNVRAFLRAIRAGESSQNDDAYRMLVYGGFFSDFSTHPKIYKPIPNHPLGWKTSAAGAYQITYSTFKWLAPLAGVSDFSPDSQDKMAVAYLRKNDALRHIIAGDYEIAIENVRDVWEAITVPSLKQKMDVAFISYGGTTRA